MSIFGRTIYYDSRAFNFNTINFGKFISVDEMQNIDKASFDKVAKNIATTLYSIQSSNYGHIDACETSRLAKTIYTNYTYNNWSMQEKILYETMIMARDDEHFIKILLEANVNLKSLSIVLKYAKKYRDGEIKEADEKFVRWIKNLTTACKNYYDLITSEQILNKCSYVVAFKKDVFEQMETEKSQSEEKDKLRIHK